MTERDDVIKGLEKVWDAFNHMEHELYADYVFDALEMLEQAELVQHGHWVLPDICYEDMECSVCHAYMPIPVSFDYRPSYKYCPMCGAKMDEVIT